MVSILWCSLAKWTINTNPQGSLIQITVIRQEIVEQSPGMYFNFCWYAYSP
ncbi:mitochondrial outer membrane iml2 [Gossypium arboreum]|uniref:Mitochondrial outer membrane iml2 n=1 Tax=Gossypium arboreum TaxID=29729 RepID=A0A0B0MNH8_GOSAR|nr:mitochondrial outer membrane iml2 [Gossypium arboreum]KHG03668.1 mitochondrial outer membrane iml2 [Gossypium arboreum]